METQKSIEKKYGLAWLAMRGEPVHSGHVANIVWGLSKADHLAVMLGSSNLARSYKNPLTFEERKLLIEECFPDEVADGRLIIVAMPDFGDNQLWANNTTSLVYRVCDEILANSGRLINDKMIAVAGFRKDASTCEYLDMFPQWDDIFLSERHSDIDATAIREHYFRDEPVILREHLPEPTIRFLEAFLETDTFKILLKERKNIDFCKEFFNKDDPENYTGDIMIVQGSKVLLVTRGGDYGHGLLAFPGGIRDPGEVFLTCSLRELNEEARLCELNPNISFDDLTSWVVGEIYNDKKGRDLRGRYTTNLYILVVPDDVPPIVVAPADDAMDAKFYDTSDLDPRRFFADHWFMLRDGLGIVADYKAQRAIECANQIEFRN
jgi:bifunctional NMN adenylyltransferase/nudix hydrolase